MARLTELQKQEIDRLRLANTSYKEIARILKCTPKQVMHCWADSTAYKPHPTFSIGAQKRQKGNLATWQTKRHAAVAQQQLAKATEALKREIAQAVAEAAHAPRLKTGNLVW